MSPTLDRSSEIQHFECTDAIEIHNRILGSAAHSVQYSVIIVFTVSLVSTVFVVSTVSTASVVFAVSVVEY